MPIFEEINHFHLIGIGGIGMSALARFFLSQGKTVSGSDQNDSDLIRELKEEGAQIHLGHGQIPAGTEAVIYSEAIPESNPERLEAAELPSLNYFEALGEISKNYKLLAVAGSHGKTTTTAMLGYLLQEAGLDPTVLVGSKVPQFGNKNFRQGQSEWMVVEACEYRRNFLPLHPYILGITNIELDHLDYFSSEADYHAAFDELKGQSQRVVKALDFAGEVGVPGLHNRLNAGLAAAMAQAIGVTDFSPLARFQGTWRRFQRRGEWNGAPVIDDYAHHPTEIKVTLMTAKEEFPDQRVVAVFQPHQHSRTTAFLDEFVQALSAADLVLIPNIYATRDSEADKAAMSAELFVEALQKAGVDARFTGSLEGTRDTLDQNLNVQDVLVVMGAGDVTRLIDLKTS